MARLFQDRLLCVWALLVAVTLVSAAIGGAGGAAWIGSAVLVIALAKTALVMHTFMDLRSAPRGLRVIACLWLTCALAALLAAYFGIIV